MGRVFPEDYVCYQGDPASPTTDTFTVLAAAAVRTNRIRLGVEVTPLTRRRPWVVARQAAAVDQLSGGRMILGVGFGDTGESVGADSSFTRFGEETDTRRRGEMLDEGLAILTGLWAGKRFSFRGRHYAVAVGGRPRHDDWEEEREHIRGVRDAGATWWIEWIALGERDEMRAAADRGPLR